LLSSFRISRRREEEYPFQHVRKCNILSVDDEDVLMGNVVKMYKSLVGKGEESGL